MNWSSVFTTFVVKFHDVNNLIPCITRLLQKFSDQSILNEVLAKCGIVAGIIELVISCHNIYSKIFKM